MCFIIKKVSDIDSKKISGGKQYIFTVDQIVLDQSDFEGGELEDALKPKSSITWGNSLRETVPMPWSKNASINWNNETWTPILAQCGFRQNEVIWESTNGNYLIPTGIHKQGRIGYFWNKFVGYIKKF